jgi:hypothetical protein
VSKIRIVQSCPTGGFFFLHQHHHMQLSVSVTLIILASLRYVVGPAVVEWLKGRRVKKSVKPRSKTS